MKVLFHCHEFPPQAGGVGSYIYQMALGIKQAGHEAVVVTGRVAGQPDEEENACGRIYRMYDRNVLRSRRTARMVLNLARNEHVDWIEGSDHLGELGPILGHKQRPPVVVKIHGSNPIRVVNESQVIYPWQRQLIRLALLRNWHQTVCERRSISKADMALIPSRRLHQELVNQGLPLPKRVAIVPNPIAPIETHGEALAPEPTVLFPARLEARKGIQFLPGIVASVCTAIPNAVFEVAGADVYARGIGSLKSWLLNALGSWGERVTFAGILSPDEMRRAYRRAWTVILPTKWDNFPVALLEAMAHGKAIVTTHSGGMAEMLHGTSCAIESPETPRFAERVIEFLDNPEIRDRAGSEARMKAHSTYNSERVVHDYLRTISEWLGR